MHDEVISKTRRKKEMIELQSLGAKLVELPESQLAAMPLEEDLRQAILEAWRERLLADDAALTDFAVEHPGADLQAVRVLIRNARKEQKEARPPRAYRELFRL